MKKNNSLQNKLSSASAGPSKTPSPPTQLLSHQATPPNPASLAPPKSSVSLSATVSTVTVPPSANSRAVFSSRPTPSRAKTPEPSRRSSAISSNKRPRDTAADTPSDDQSEMPAVTIGKKRRLPDDADAVCAPVEARFAESHVPMSSTPPMPSSSSMTTMPSMPSMFEMTTTPRARRQAPRTGFTPVRGQNGTLRPTLSQPSPIRKSTASRALEHPSAITDVTNSPPKAKHVFGMQDSTGSAAPRAQKPSGKGWLGKIRGGGNNPLLRTRQQPRADDAS
ncbi:hypothetical protein DFH11DRAFT_7033 [Phellopilus nigrolimitatus]|nr:hypothetical protein DFH11DRAFT_7033 [Phellopilus nigrolimitatus]